MKFFSKQWWTSELELELELEPELDLLTSWSRSHVENERLHNSDMVSSFLALCLAWPLSGVYYYWISTSEGLIYTYNILMSTLQHSMWIGKIWTLEFAWKIIIFKKNCKTLKQSRFNFLWFGKFNNFRLGLKGQCHQIFDNFFIWLKKLYLGKNYQAKSVCSQKFSFSRRYSQKTSVRVVNANTSNRVSN